MYKFDSGFYFLTLLAFCVRYYSINYMIFSKIIVTLQAVKNGYRKRALIRFYKKSYFATK